MSQKQDCKSSCVSGFEHVRSSKKTEDHFAFNRIRALPPNRLPNAHLPVKIKNIY
jgi:hypothetical protein